MPANKWRDIKFMEGVVWSRDLRWIVHLHIDSRMNPTEVHATCQHSRMADGPIGHAGERIGPFDDINEVINRVMIDSAVNGWDQLTFNL